MLTINFINLKTPTSNATTKRNTKPYWNNISEKDCFVSFSSSKNAEPKQIMVTNIKDTFHNKIKVLFPDIDGTIRDFDGNISKQTKNALKEFQNNNLNIVLSTGRTYTEGKELYNKLGIKSNYMITQQGAEIVDPQGEIIYQKPLDLNISELMIESFEYYKNQYNDQAKMLV